MASKRGFPLGFLVLVIVLWIMVTAILFGIGGDYGKAGTIGDSFGAVNALFSGFAFVGLIYTILLQTDQIEQNSEQIEMQREELALQREELKLTREELAKSAEAQVRSARIAEENSALSAETALLNYYCQRAAYENESEEESIIHQNSVFRHKSPGTLFIQKADQRAEGILGKVSGSD